MDSIRQYLLSVITGAIISGIAITLVQKNSAHAVIMKLLCGLFMMITVIAPLTKFDFTNMQEFTGAFSADAQMAVNAGEVFTEQQLRKNITQQTEAYIQKRAQELGADLNITIELTAEEPPVPSAVMIKGAVSPYVKGILCRYIENNLAIPEDKQIWM